MRRLAPWLLALLTVGLGHLTHTPYTLKIRGFELMLVILFGALALRVAKERRAPIAAIFALGLVLGLTREITFERARSRVEAAPKAQLARLGRHLIVGYRDPTEAQRWLDQGRIGGIFVSGRNAKGHTTEALADELSTLRRHGARWIAADQEGGPVSRLSPPLTALPPLGEIAHDLAGVDAYGESHGADLAAIGVDLNFAPVLDLPVHREASLLDFHTRIEERALGDDPQAVGAAGVVYARALSRHGVTATFKHFPGLGRVADDTHHFEARLEGSVEQLEATDWAPFRRAVAGSDGAVMVGHVIVEEVDRAHIATRSRALVTGVLREGLGHQGLVVTDDLCMAPAFHGEGGIGRAAVDGIRAGVDLLLVSYDPEQWYVVMAALLDADDAGELSEPLAASLLRVELALSRSARSRVRTAHDRLLFDPRASGAAARGADVRDAGDGARVAGM